MDRFALIVYGVIISIPCYFIVKKFGAVTLGAIFAVLGSVAFGYGATERSSIKYELAYATGSGEAKFIDAIYYIGIAALIVGLIILVIQFTKRKK